MSGGVRVPRWAEAPAPAEGDPRLRRGPADYVPADPRPAYLYV